MLRNASDTENNRAKLLPERIREAREARGYTMEEFAEHLGVTKQAVGQYETGQVVPTGRMLSLIIGVTGQPPGFFTADRKRNASGFGVPFWRSLKRMDRPNRLRISRRLAWAFDVVTYIENFIDLPRVNIRIIDWDYDTATDEDIERAAEQVRDHWALGRGAIFHLSALLESNGIIIVKEKVKCDDMDAVSRWQGGRPYILCSADEDKDYLPRKNFDLAHELGHLILHYGVEVCSDNLAKVEAQANRFAGAFMLPRETFAKDVLSSSLDYFIGLKKHWRVSAQSMIYRSKDLGLLSKHQVGYLWRQVASRKMKRFEQYDDMFETERPSVLADALQMLVQHNVQSRAQILSAINLNSDDLSSICGTVGGFFEEKVVTLGWKPRSA